MRIEELEESLRHEKIASLYLLYGEEKFLLENCVKKIKKIFGELLVGINYINIDNSNISEIIPNIETPAFGFEKKLIIAQNTGLFKKETKKKGEEQKNKNRVLEYLEENFEDIKNNIVLIFVEEDIDKCELQKFIEKNGVLCKFEYQKPFQIQERMKKICSLYKVNIDNATLSYFIECCGTDMQELINEIRKLIEYVGENGTIKKETVDILATKKIESIIFDLTDSLGRKNTTMAIDVLRNLILAKEPIQKILITLYNHFKKLYLVKLAVKENKNIITSLNLKPNQTFLVNKYKKQSDYFKTEEIRTILQELCDLDYKYKIGLIDLELGFEAILCAYC